MTVVELRQPRVADAGMLGDVLPVALSPDEQGADLKIEWRFHAPRLAKICSTGKQLFTDEHAQTRGMGKSINIVLAENLEHFMRKRNIDSQQALAEKSGVAQRTISNYLNPDRRQVSKSGKEPSAKLTEVEQIARALDVEVWDLLRDLSPSERELYANIEAAYRKLVEATASSPTAPGDRRSEGERRKAEHPKREDRANQLDNPWRTKRKDRRAA